MPSELSIFTCDICGARFDFYEAAAACESRGLPEPCCEVGDYVLVGTFGHGWWAKSPNPAWWVLPTHGWKWPGDTCPNGVGNCFKRCCNASPIYRVLLVERRASRPSRGTVAIDGRGHSWRYTLGTRAFAPGSGREVGVTYERTHITPRVIPRPDWVVVDEPLEDLASYCDQGGFLETGRCPLI